MAQTDHPLVRRFVAGVLNTRPPMPQYVQVWDIGIVISYLRGLGETLKLIPITLNPEANHSSKHTFCNMGQLSALTTDH